MRFGQWTWGDIGNFAGLAVLQIAALGSSAGRVPLTIGALTDSARTVLAALLLIFPGVVSDLIALTLLLLPGPRMAAESAARHSSHGTLIEGEFRRTR